MFDGPTLADPTVLGNGDVRAVSYGSDAGLFVEFRMENVHQEYESELQGKPVYKQVPFVKIYIPGDKTKTVDRPARMEGFADVPSDPQRFPRQWAAFQQGVKAVSEGFPLEEWTQMTASSVRDLHAINIYTVEQLANVPDSALDGLGHGGRHLRDKAKAHLERLQDDSITARLVADKAELQRQIDELKATISPENEKRGPGRPKKDVEDAV